MVKPLLDFLYSGLKVRLQKGNSQLVCHSLLRLQRGLSILQKDFGVQRGAKAWYKCWGGISHYLCCQIPFLLISATGTGQFCIKSVKALHRQFRSRGRKKTLPDISLSVSIYFFLFRKEYNASTSPLGVGIAAFLRSPLFYYIFTSVCGGLTLLKLSCQKALGDSLFLQLSPL